MNIHKHKTNWFYCLWLISITLLCGKCFTETTYRVVNVEKGDSLNVRAKNNHKAPIITKIPYNGKDITLLSQSGKWNRIKVNTYIGWVNNNYLEKEREIIFKEDLLCFGNEPYWQLEITKSTIILSNPQDSKREYQITTLQQSLNNTNQWYIYGTSANDGEVSIFIQEENCSDDMSDNRYKYCITMYDSAKDQTINGCCNK